MTFADDLNKFAANAKARINRTVRSVVIDIDRSLVEKSPVGNPDLWANPGNAPPGYVGGRFRSNWQYGEGDKPQGELYTPVVGPFPDASAAIEAVIGKVGIEAGGKVHYLVNNLPYAQAIEDGHSARQAPAGVVGRTVIEFEQFVGAAVRGL